MVGHLRQMGEEIRADLVRQFPESRCIPPSVLIFIKSRQDHCEKDVPSVPNPVLDTIGIMDYALQADPAEEHVRWLMCQQIARLVFAAGSIGWDYTAPSLGPLIARKNDLVAGVFDGEKEIAEIGISQLDRVIDSEILLSSPRYIWYPLLPEDPAVTGEMVNKYLTSPKNLADAHMMLGFAAAHIMAEIYPRCDHVEFKRTILCMAIASELSGVDMHEMLGVFPFNVNFKRDVRRVRIRLDSSTLQDFFSGRIRHKELLAFKYR